MNHDHETTVTENHRFCGGEGYRRISHVRKAFWPPKGANPFRTIEGRLHFFYGALHMRGFTHVQKLFVSELKGKTDEQIHGFRLFWVKDSRPSEKQAQLKKSSPNYHIYPTWSTLTGMPSTASRVRFSATSMPASTVSGPPSRRNKREGVFIRYIAYISHPILDFQPLL